MLWRIHFTAADLARTRIRPTLGPLAETVMALSMLRCPMQPRTLFSKWRGRVGGQLTAQAKPLLTLIPPGTFGVDLCTLTGEAPTIEQGIEALLAIPQQHLLGEMQVLDRHRRLPASAWEAAEQGSHARRQLADGVLAAHAALVEPYWPRIQLQLRAEQACRSKILADGGPERLLTTLQTPRIRWQPPVLEVTVTDGGDVCQYHLDGRGLQLVPTMFTGELPMLLHNPADQAAAPRLLFPVARDPAASAHLTQEAQPAGAALAALVGRTRAAVLHRIANACTTTELARRVGISIAAASQHATVLRDAGLITTRRRGSAVLHSLTPLGAQLLEAGQPSKRDQARSRPPAG